MDQPFAASRAAFLHAFQDVLASTLPASLVVTVENESTEHFVQFMWMDPTEVQWEVGTYRGKTLFGKPRVFLTNTQQAQLRAHGFAPDPVHHNYTRHVQIDGERAYAAIMEESVDLLANVYGSDPNARLLFEIIRY